MFIYFWICTRYQAAWWWLGATGEAWIKSCSYFPSLQSSTTTVNQRVGDGEQERIGAVEKQDRGGIREVVMVVHILTHYRTVARRAARSLQAKALTRPGPGCIRLALAPAASMLPESIGIPAPDLTADAVLSRVLLAFAGHFARDGLVSISAASAPRCTCR